LGVDGVHPGQCDQEQADSKRDGTHGDDEADSGLLPGAQGEAKTEADHDTTASHHLAGFEASHCESEISV